MKGGVGKRGRGHWDNLSENGKDMAEEHILGKKTVH